MNGPKEFYCEDCGIEYVRPRFQRRTKATAIWGELHAALHDDQLFRWVTLADLMGDHVPDRIRQAIK